LQRIRIALLLIGAYLLLVLGLPSSALVVAALAVGVWVLRRWPIHEQM
jgi:hypothetical protein